MKIRTRRALVGNAKRRVKKSGLRVDPTRTAMMRKAFVRALRKRFSALKVDILKLVVDADAFGLRSKHRVFNVTNGWVTLDTDQRVFIGDRGEFQPGGPDSEPIKSKWGTPKQPFWRPGANPTVDNVITRDGPNGKEVLLIRRKEGAVEGGKYALPGGFHDTQSRRGQPWQPGHETAQQAALRELAEETGLDLGGSVDDFAKVSDEALDKVYGYGRSAPGSFGEAANRASARAFLDAAENTKNIERLAEAVHTGWGRAVRDHKDQPPEKRAAREKLAKTKYKDLPDHEKEKDRVAARAMLAKLGGMRKVGVYEGGGRDPRDNREAWSKSTAFHLHLTDEQAARRVEGRDDADKAQWFSVSSLPQLAFDHARILRDAGVTTNSQPTTNAPDWRFMPDPDKVRAFQGWLRTQVARRLRGASEEKLWDSYIRAAYERGQGRAFDDATRGRRGREPLDFYRGSRRQFLQDSFRQPVSRERVQVLAGRSFDDLENVTTDMSTRIQRTLVDGLIQGQNPREIARDMAEDVDIGRQRGELIARTEIIRAHAEGQLDALERLGVAEVGVQVEWSTAGDDRVCPDCVDMEGTVLGIEDAHGMIPRHPNCRCAWVPAGVGEAPTENRYRFVFNAFCATGEGGGVDPTCSPAERVVSDDVKAVKAAASFVNRWSWTGVKALPTIAAEKLLKESRPKEPITLYRFEREDHDLVKSDPKKLGLQAWTKDRRMAEGIADLKNEDQPIGSKYIVKERTFKPHEVYADFTNLPPSVVKELDRIGGGSEMNEVLIRNAFCPTGPGGGVDPTCGKGTVVERGILSLHDRLTGTGSGKLKELVKSNYEKLPSAVRSVIDTVHKVAFAGWHASQAVAEQVAKEQGLSDENAAKLRATLASADLVAYKPAAVAAAATSGVAAALLWVVPPATGAYLLTSAATSPFRTYRAASKLVKAKIAEHTDVLNVFCPTGEGGGVDPSCSLTPSVGSNVTYQGKEYKVTGGGEAAKRGANKGRKPIVLTSPSGEIKIVYADEFAKEKPEKEVAKEKSEKKELTFEEIEARYDPIGHGNVDVSNVRDKSIHILDSLPKNVKDEIVSYMRRDGFELRKVELKNIKPNQSGEDRVNDSSRHSAATISSGDLGRIARADVAPIVLGKGNNIIDGNHRFSAAELNNQKYIYAFVEL